MPKGVEKAKSEDACTLINAQALALLSRTGWTKALMSLGKARKPDTENCWARAMHTQQRLSVSHANRRDSDE